MEKNVFVKIEDYKEILDVIALVNEKLQEAKTVLGKINDLKNQEDSELEAWKSSLENVERKIAHVNKTLFEPRF